MLDNAGHAHEHWQVARDGLQCQEVDQDRFIQDWCKHVAYVGPHRDCCPGMKFLRSYSTDAEFAILGFCSFFALVVLVSFFVAYRNDISIKQRACINMNFDAACMGILLVVIGVLMWPKNPENWTCIAKPFFFAVGFGLMSTVVLYMLLQAYNVFVLSLNPKKSVVELLSYNSKEARILRKERNKLYILAATLCELAVVGILTLIPQTRSVAETMCCTDTNIAHSTCMMHEPLGFLLALTIVNVIPWIFGWYWVIQLYRLRQNLKDTLSKEKDAVAENVQQEPLAPPTRLPPWSWGDEIEQDFETGVSTSTSPTISHEAPKKHKTEAIQETAESVALELIREQLRLLKPVLFLTFFVSLSIFGILIYSLIIGAPHNEKDYRDRFYITRSIMILSLACLGFGFLICPPLWELWRIHSSFSFAPYHAPPSPTPRQRAAFERLYMPDHATLERQEHEALTAS